MAVLKSPKNVKRKPLWSAKLRHSTKKNLFYFYESENRFTVSPRHSYAVRKDHIMDPTKYRYVKGDYKRSFRAHGPMFPSSLRAPDLPRVSCSILAPQLNSPKSHPLNRAELSLLLYGPDVYRP